MTPPNQKLSFEQYTQAAEALHVLSGVLLLEFVRRDGAPSLRDQIARNFIARADTLVKGIFRLWEIEDRADCWTLHRTLLDRLFHLHEINQNDQFEAFDDWSFKALYEAANRLRSDTELKGQIDGLVEDLTPERKNRYGQLVKTAPNWRRPKAEDTAKDMGLGFLYRYGYDYASRYVHPMSNDGLNDFYRITGLKPPPETASAEITVLSNSVLIASMIFQEALNASSLSWMALAYDAIDGVRAFLASAESRHHQPLLKLVQVSETGLPFAKLLTRTEAP